MSENKASFSDMQGALPNAGRLVSGRAAANMSRIERDGEVLRLARGARRSIFSIWSIRSDVPCGACRRRDYRFLYEHAGIYVAGQRRLFVVDARSPRDPRVSPMSALQGLSRSASMDDGLADDPTIDLDLPFELSWREGPLSHGLLQERIFSFSVEITHTVGMIDEVIVRIRR